MGRRQVRVYSLSALDPVTDLKPALAKSSTSVPPASAAVDEDEVDEQPEAGSSKAPRMKTNKVCVALLSFLPPVYLSSLSCVEKGRELLHYCECQEQEPSTERVKTRGEGEGVEEVIGLGSRSVPDLCFVMYCYL